MKTITVIPPTPKPEYGDWHIYILEELKKKYQLNSNSNGSIR